MRRIIFLYFFTAGLFTYFPAAKAQVPFSQVSQTPLLLNPSLAGSKEKKRIGVAGNRYRRPDLGRSNFYLGYDQMVEKIGSGVGVYFLHLSGEKEALKDDWKMFSTFGSKNDSETLSASTIGLSVAPKYNLRAKGESDRGYTFSPSLLLGYTKGIFRHRRYDQTYGMQYHYAQWGIAKDSLQVFSNKITSRQIKCGLGVQLNNQSFMVVYQVVNEIEFKQDDVDVTRISNPSGESSKMTVKESYRVHAVTQSLSAAKSFSSADDRFSITPSAGIGIVSYLNESPNKTIRPTEDIYYMINFEKKRTIIHYSHASLNIRMKKLLLGAAYTYYRDNEYYGATIGFQSASVRIMTTLSWPSSHLSSELSLAILI